MAMHKPAAARASTPRKARASERASMRARAGTSCSGRKGPRLALEGERRADLSRAAVGCGFPSDAEPGIAVFWGWGSRVMAGDMRLWTGKTVFRLPSPSELHVNAPISFHA